MELRCVVDLFLSCAVKSLFSTGAGRPTHQKSPMLLFLEDQSVRRLYYATKSPRRAPDGRPGKSEEQTWRFETSRGDPRRIASLPNTSLVEPPSRTSPQHSRPPPPPGPQTPSILAPPHRHLASFALRSPAQRLAPRAPVSRKPTRTKAPPSIPRAGWVGESRSGSSTPWAGKERETAAMATGFVRGGGRWAAKVFRRGRGEVARLARLGAGGGDCVGGIEVLVRFRVNVIRKT